MGSDVASVAMTAEKKGGIYVVNGTKHWVTNGMNADFCTAAVRTSGAEVAGKHGISVLIIPLSADGISREDIPRSGARLGGMS